MDEYVDVSKLDIEIPDQQHTTALINIIKNAAGKLRKGRRQLQWNAGRRPPQLRDHPPR
jgi:hypothetical protein